MSVRLLALLLITALPSFAKLPARAQESDFTLTAEQVENPPERDLEFEESSIEVQRRLPRPDQSLLEKNFVATLRVWLSK